MKLVSSRLSLQDSDQMPARLSIEAVGNVTLIQLASFTHFIIIEQKFSSNFSPSLG